MKLSVALTFCLIAIIGLTDQISAKGSVPLDSWSFDKITSRFPVSIVKFDVAYPYGPKHEAYYKMAEAAKNSADVLVAEVGIKDYGEKENSDLAERFHIDKEKFPVVKLFVEGKEPITFKEETEEGFTPDNLIQFIRSNSGKYIGLPGCLENYDKLAAQFKTADEKKRKEILKEAEGLLKNSKNDEERKSGDLYVKMMKRMVEKGLSFIDDEIKRVNKLLQGKLTADKKSEMGHRVNILRAFRDEL